MKLPHIPDCGRIFITSNYFYWILLKMHQSPNPPVWCVVMLTAEDPFLSIPPGSAKGLVSVVFCWLEHKDGIVDLQGRAQLDAEYFNDVILLEEQEGLAINLLEVGIETGQGLTTKEQAGFPFLVILGFLPSSGPYTPPCPLSKGHRPHLTALSGNGEAPCVLPMAEVEWDELLRAFLTQTIPWFHMLYRLRHSEDAIWLEKQSLLIHQQGHTFD